MKTIFLRCTSAASAALAALCFGLSAAGCESAESHSVSVSPGYARLRGGESVALEASGWDDFSWSLDVSGVGHLSGATGKSVVFTAETGVAESSTVTVTATAIGSGGSGSSTNSAAGYSAPAVIEVGS